MARKKKEPKLEPGFAWCQDCGRSYKIGYFHAVLCEARICSKCDATFNHVLRVHNPKTRPPTRLCERCLNETRETKTRVN